MVRGKSKKKNWQWVKSPRVKKAMVIFRWLHIYMSTALFGLLIFFCVTGIFLNHLDWFESIGQHETIEDNVPVQLSTDIAANKSGAIFELTKFIEEKYGWNNPNKVSLDQDLGEANLDYKLPAGYVFITLFFDEQKIEIEKQEGTVIAILNDLHKGRNTGGFWSLLIDFFAVLTIVFSISGVAILLQQAKWRKTGLWLVLIGFLSPIIFYYLLVPKV